MAHVQFPGLVVAGNARQLINWKLRLMDGQIGIEIDNGDEKVALESRLLIRPATEPRSVLYSEHMQKVCCQNFATCQ